MKQNFKLSLQQYGMAVLLGTMLIGISNGTMAKSPADPNKVLRYAFPVAETGFDPAAVQDLYSAHVLYSIFDTLYTYDYLASPAKLIPNTAAALPEVSADGLTYTIRLKKGIYFPPYLWKTNQEDSVELRIKDPTAFKYSEFASIVDFLIEKYGRDKFERYMKSLLINHDNNAVFKDIYGIDFNDFLKDFIKMAKK